MGKRVITNTCDYDKKTETIDTKWVKSKRRILITNRYSDYMSKKLECHVRVFCDEKKPVKNIVFKEIDSDWYRKMMTEIDELILEYNDEERSL